MSEFVYLNGEYVKRDEAKISPDDRGFIFADGVYEVVKYYNGRPFRYNDHLERLNRSLSEIGIKYRHPDQLTEIFYELLFRNKLDKVHAGIYLQITRGANKRVHHFPDNLAPTVYVNAFELPSYTEKLEKGIKVITQQDIRWLRCDIKSVSLLPNSWLFNTAVNNGAGESILIRDGKVTEATHSSVLGVKNGVVITHPLNNFILPGITRKVVLEICRDNAIPVAERPISENELFDLDEIMIVGTGSEITPVVQIDDKIIDGQNPGNITRFLQKKFFEMV